MSELICNELAKSYSHFQLYLPGKTAPENQLFYAALPGLIRPAPVM